MNRVEKRKLGVALKPPMARYAMDIKARVTLPKRDRGWVFRSRMTMGDDQSSVESGAAPQSNGHRQAPEAPVLDHGCAVPARLPTRIDVAPPKLDAGDAVVDGCVELSEVLQLLDVLPVNQTAGART